MDSFHSRNATLPACTSLATGSWDSRVIRSKLKFRKRTNSRPCRSSSSTRSVSDFLSPCLIYWLGLGCEVPRCVRFFFIQQCLWPQHVWNASHRCVKVLPKKSLQFFYCGCHALLESHPMRLLFISRDQVILFALKFRLQCDQLIIAAAVKCSFNCA